MRSNKLRVSTHQNPVPPVPSTIWHQLPESRKLQLAHLVAQLIQRQRRAKRDKEQGDEH